MFRKKRNNFRRQKNQNKKPLRKILFLAILILLIYFFLFSRFFTLKTIKFTEDTVGAESLITEIKETLEPSLGKHLFKLDIQKINQSLNEEFPEITGIEVQKSYPSSLKINFQKQPLIANVINETPNSKKSYIISASGQTIKENFESPNLPYIYLLTQEPVNPEKPLMEASEVDYILKSIEDFSTRFGMKIVSARFKPVAREVHLLTEKEFYIWLDIQQSYENQFKKLKKALPKLDIYTLALEYIDLRIAGNEGDRIIYKPK